MAETNWLLEIFRLLPATIIAASVAYIAYMQWRTAHTKLILELFDKRLEVYEGVLEANAKATANEENMRDAHFALFDLRSDAAFLFGEDVTSVISNIITCIATQRLNSQRLKREKLSSEDRDRFATELFNASNNQDRLIRDFRKACAPYMKITSKQVRTPSEWFKEKNEARWSYADEKQRPGT